jgi:hypothetical protein
VIWRGRRSVGGGLHQGEGGHGGGDTLVGGQELGVRGVERGGGGGGGGRGAEGRVEAAAVAGRAGGGLARVYGKHKTFLLYQ